jgi:hypothetical protein
MFQTGPLHGGLSTRPRHPAARLSALPCPGHPRLQAGLTAFLRDFAAFKVNSDVNETFFNLNRASNDRPVYVGVDCLIPLMTLSWYLKWQTHFFDRAPLDNGGTRFAIASLMWQPYSQSTLRVDVALPVGLSGHSKYHEIQVHRPPFPESPGSSSKVPRTRDPCNWASTRPCPNHNPRNRSS